MNIICNFYNVLKAHLAGRHVRLKLISQYKWKCRNFWEKNHTIEELLICLSGRREGGVLFQHYFWVKLFSACPSLLLIFVHFPILFFWVAWTVDTGNNISLWTVDISYTSICSTSFQAYGTIRILQPGHCCSFSSGFWWSSQTSKYQYRDHLVG